MNLLEEAIDARKKQEEQELECMKERNQKETDRLLKTVSRFLTFLQIAPTFWDTVFLADRLTLEGWIDKNRFYVAHKERQEADYKSLVTVFGIVARCRKCKRQHHICLVDDMENVINRQTRIGVFALIGKKIQECNIRCVCGDRITRNSFDDTVQATQHRV